MGTAIVLILVLGYTGYVAYKHFVKKEGCCEAGCSCPAKEEIQPARKAKRKKVGEKMEETFKISNMKCEGCVKNVKTAVTNLSGVDHVDVDLPNKEAKVTFDTENIDTTAIKQAIEDAGYHVED